MSRSDWKRPAILWKSCCRAAALCLSLGSGCAPQGDDGAVAARVGDAVLTRAEVDNQIPGEAVAGERRQFAEDWVRQQLLYQEAVERDLPKSARLQRLIAQAQRDLVVATLLDETFENQQIDVSASEVEQYYRLHAADYTRTDAEIRVQHILLGTWRDANAVRQGLLAGDDFDDKAQELSIDRGTVGAGGDLGYFTADDHPELWEGCDGLSIGQTSQPVATKEGFHILRLVDRKEPGSSRDLADVRDEIVETLVRQKHRERLEELVERLKSKHSWQIDQSQLGEP